MRSWAVLGMVAAVCLLLLTLQMRGYMGGAADVLAVVTTPVQTVFARVNRAAFGLWATYVDWKTVRTENVKLRQEAQRLRVEALQVSEGQEENRRLRQLLGLKTALPIATVSGEIIAREWGGWVRSLTVNRGRADQVARLTAVIAPDGLVGRVVDVRPGASVVQVLTDPASNIGAHVVRTRTQGIVEGEPRGTMRFKYMARDGGGIQVGDLIVTSGAGGLFPRGLPIGRVHVIDDRGSALFSYAQLTPAVDFARIDEVLLIVGEGAHDVASLFPAGGS
jgi:rod shape-determining protein MreC